MSKILNFIYKTFMRIYERIGSQEDIITNLSNSFHKLYYKSLERTWNNTYWLGKRILKCPLDLWIYQEIIFEQKPDVIIECGTSYGGSAFFLAKMCDIVENGRVLTIDIVEEKDRPMHDRIKYFKGSSISNEIVEQIKKEVKQGDKVLVILDSDHSKSHVLNELRSYCGMVTKGSYLIVEDSNINGHPVANNFGPGPMEAIFDFLKENKDFIIDKPKEKFFLTFNPNGYLRKIK